MATYGLIKATSLARRIDTINDLAKVNKLRAEIKLKPVVPLGPSVRKLENCVALAICCITITLPKLIRGESFYRSLMDEISIEEQKKWYKQNQL